MSYVTRNSTLLASIWNCGLLICCIITLLVHSIAIYLFTSSWGKCICECLRKVPSLFLVSARKRHWQLGPVPSKNNYRYREMRISREKKIRSYRITFFLPLSLSLSLSLSPSLSLSFSLSPSLARSLSLIVLERYKRYVRLYLMLMFVQRRCIIPT